MLVGVIRTGLSEADPAGLIVNLDCLESDSDLTRRLWTAEIHAPSPTGPDTWPFHFSIPEEAPPSGLSPNGVVLWRLRARTASRSVFGASFDLGVARVQGPPSRVLPVPPPTLLSRSGGARRYIRVSEEAGGVVVRLGARTSFPGPNPIVLWAFGLVAALWLLVMTVASSGAYVFLGLANAAVALGLLYTWFARVELRVTSDEVIVRRVFFKFSDARRFARSELTGLRVNLTGPEPLYGVRMERGNLRPVGVFEGFSNLLDAHEAARTLSRILGRPVV
ncbi:MAG: hypothetical protein IPP35_00715 [Elusimicrobia bacterium]|nr:hypothetical protein [Elusimicrobiota bacterium]